MNSTVGVRAASALAWTAALGLSSALCVADVKSWRTSRSPLSAAPPQHVRVQDPNQAGTFWSNLLVPSAELFEPWRGAQTEREARLALEDGAEYAAANGFGSWGIFEFGPRTVLHEPSGWDRPIHQFSDLTPMHQRALREAIAHAKRLGLEVYGYIGTLDRSGEDVPPAANDVYLDELTLMADAGFDRIYIDASCWNTHRTNEQRPNGVGGGMRRDGVLALRAELAARGIDLEVAMEAWPMENGRILTETGPAMIQGSYLSQRRQQGRMNLEENPFGGDLRVTLFNINQDATNEEALYAAADAGYIFDAGSRVPALIELVRELNARARDVRDQRESSDAPAGGSDEPSRAPDAEPEAGRDAAPRAPRGLPAADPAPEQRAEPAKQATKPETPRRRKRPA